MRLAIKTGVRGFSPHPPGHAAPTLQGSRRNRAGLAKVTEMQDGAKPKKV